MILNSFLQTVISQPTLVYGGVLGYAIRMTNTEKYLIGKKVTDPTTLKTALQILQNVCTFQRTTSNSIFQETNPDPGPGRVAYRKSLVTAFFYKFFLSLQPNLPPPLQSAVVPFVRPVTSGQQSYQTSP